MRREDAEPGQIWISGDLAEYLYPLHMSRTDVLPDMLEVGKTTSAFSSLLCTSDFSLLTLTRRRFIFSGAFEPLCYLYAKTDVGTDSVFRADGLQQCGGAV